MGLDMYIYKRTDKYAKIEKAYAKLTAQLEIELDEYFATKKTELEVIIQGFIHRYEKFILIPSRSTASVTSSAKYLITTYSADSTDENFVDSIKWDLFNNLSAFDYNAPSETKTAITLDFIESVRPLCILDNLKEICKMRKLYSELQDNQIEVAYWRKYDKLNRYILENHEYSGDGNCAYIELSKDDLQLMQEFVSTCLDSIDAEQITNILENWCEDCIYMYHPWW